MVRKSIQSPTELDASCMIVLSSAKEKLHKEAIYQSDEYK